MVKEGVKVETIGDLSSFPEDVQRELCLTKEATKENITIELVLALNYGGRDDIRRAAQKIAKKCVLGELRWEELSEELISSHLDTDRWKDPELIIRTGGEKRASNFLLWQSSYSEVVVSDVLWPDFGKKDLIDALKEYQKRERRIGS